MALVLQSLSTELDDATQIDATEKLPKFTITGTQGSGSTALPAGYQKLQVLTNAAVDPGGMATTQLLV